MTDASGADRRQQWVLVVRRSFGIADEVSHEDARGVLVEVIEAQLRASGWQRAPHAVAGPMVDVLMAFGANDCLDEKFLPVELPDSGDAPARRDLAHRLVDEGMTRVDPEHLVFDARGEQAPEVVATAEVALGRVFEYVRAQPLDG